MSDIRKTDAHGEIRQGAGGGAAAPDDRPDAWDKPGVTPDGRRTGSSTDGPRIALDGEGEPDPDRFADDEDDDG
jgi:hypothetical protein